MHSIGCQIDFEVSCEAFENKVIDVIQDMYGIKENIEFNKRDIEVQTNKPEKKELVNINERIQVEDILNIFDVNCYPKVINTSKSGNFYNQECELNLNIYYDADNRNGLNVKNITLPLK